VSEVVRGGPLHKRGRKVIVDQTLMVGLARKTRREEER
jgi:hypothetical protein